MKKAIFFTVLSLFMVILLYVFAWISSTSYLDYSRKAAGATAAKERVIVANDYIYSLKTTYVERALRVGSYNALKSLIAYMKNNSVFLNDVKAEFTEVLLNGTLYGSDLRDEDIYYMENNTLPHRFAQIENASMDFLRISTEFTIHDIGIMQTNDSGPFGVTVLLNLSIYVDAEISVWKQNTSLSTFVEITDLEDPVYHIKTSGSYQNRFSQTNISVWGLNATKSFIQQRAYKYEEQAPSFLLRLVDSYNASPCCGMESLIYFNSTKNISFVDYCYWYEKCQGSDPAGNFSLYNITNITTNSYQFKLEPYHLGKTKYDLLNHSLKN